MLLTTYRVHSTYYNGLPQKYINKSRRHTHKSVISPE